MSSLRSFLAALVAAPLLLAGPALAAATTPPTAKASREIPAARRVPASRRAPASRPSVAAVASRPQPVAAPVEVAAAAQPAATRLVCLSGTVLNADGQPCPGACIFPTTNTHLIAVADAHGAFQLQVPAAASLHLQADYFGLGSSRVDIDSQHPQPVRIVLGQ